MNILYLHGLNKNLSTEKRNILEKHGTVFAPLINYNSEPNNISELYELYKDEDINVVIGSGMGGFIGYYLANTIKCPALLLNPTLTTQPFLQFIPNMVLKNNNYMHLVLGTHDTVTEPKDTLKFISESLGTHPEYKIHIHYDLAHHIPINLFKEEVELFFEVYDIKLTYKYTKIKFKPMNGLHYIKSKQRNWATRKGFNPVGGTRLNVGGSISNVGEKNYLEPLTANLFGEHMTKESQDNFNSGDGNETEDSETRLAKMKALHSSSAIAVNLFQYWQNKDAYPIAYACKLCAKRQSESDVKSNNKLSNRITFEQKFEISENKELFPISPNLDIVIENINPNNNGIYAIESKFTEPYTKEHKGISERYLNDESFWKGLSNLKELAKKICPDDTEFKYLHAAQLIKHILGLKNIHGKNGFRLLYLWYDVIGHEGAEHRKEIEQFAEIAKKDNIKFNHITYQEVIIRLSKEFYIGNEDYVNYVSERYL